MYGIAVNILLLCHKFYVNDLTLVISGTIIVTRHIGVVAKKNITVC